MAQVTETLVREWLKCCEAKVRPPLTIWEIEQLLRFWLLYHIAAERNTHDDLR